ncbi:MAG: ParB/RepB/Spo0J family partition protein [Desulfovibrionaceae bacterium]|nr:ParB/RepB/Spo0J family partition protein [Desulfovibrionaceae bacterium]
MAVSPNRLGRGLGTDILFAPKESAASTELAKPLPLAQITPNLKQPRQNFNQETLEELAESIRQQGVLQPIMVRGVKESMPFRYEIVAGERRWRAAQLAGLAEIPAIVRDLDDREALFVALAENLQRENLNPLEEALGFARLKEEFQLSQDEIANMLGKKRSTIANSLRLLNLGENSRKALAENRISAGHARSILALPDAVSQDALLERILGEQLTVRDSEGLAAMRKGGEEPEGAPPTGTAASAKRPQSAILLRLQSRIAEEISLPVKISGQEDRGRVSISYATKEELASLLKKMGLETAL